MVDGFPGEKSELIPKAAPSVIAQIACEIPPLRLELGVGEVIAREFEDPAGQ
jgi:hypothetical protein